MRNAIKLVAEIWEEPDGFLMIDHNHQQPNSKKAKHINSLLKPFRKFLRDTKDLDFDIILEIKEKEKSAVRAKLLLD